jgi:hypothetical protein
VAAGPTIELLWWRECPSWERALSDLREAVRAAGLEVHAEAEPHDVDGLIAALLADPTSR